MWLNKLSVTVFCVALILVGNDVSNRFNIVDNVQPKGEETLDLAELKVPILSPRGYDEIQIALNPYLKASEDDKSLGQSTSWLSKEEQLNQQGELTDFFIGDSKLNLKAVVKTADSLYALVSVNEKLNTNSITLVKLENDTEIMDYLVKIISKNKVVFSRGEHQVALVMYQSTMNNDH